MTYGDLIYGEGTYKGDGEDISEGPILGLYSDENKCSLIYGYASDHGGLWSERSGDSWVWPSSAASVMSLFDTSRKMYDVALDSRDGMFYALNPSEDNDATIPYKDKYDLLDSTSGVAIAWDIYPGEVTGEMLHYKVFDMDLHLKLRPPWMDRHGESGYSASGLRNEFQLSITTRQDGIPDNNVSVITNVPLGQEAIHTREVTGESFQNLLHGTDAFFRLMAIEQYARVQDKPTSYDNGGLGQTEDQINRELSLPIVWLSRSLLLVNRATGRAMTASASAITGPDGRAKSAMRLTSTLSLGNNALTVGTLLLWVYNNVSYTIPGVTLTAVASGVIGLWRLYMCAASVSVPLPANITLPVGDLFDVRLYTSALSVSAVELYRDNVVNHNGDVVLP